MAAEEASTTSGDLRNDIAAAALLLGRSMEDTLPFKKAAWWKQVVGGYAESQIAVFPGGIHGDQYTRAWLRRPYAKDHGAAYPIELHSDIVRKDYALRTGQIGYTVTRPVIAARFESVVMLGGHDLSTPPAETLARLQQLGEWVTMIAQANVDAEVRGVPPYQGEYQF